MTTIKIITPTLLAVVVMLALVATAAAQTTPRNGSQLGAEQDQLQDGSGDGIQRGVTDGIKMDDDDDNDSVLDGTDEYLIQQQDRNRLQDLTEDDEPDQDQTRAQDQDRLQDGTGNDCDDDCDGIQDRLQIRTSEDIEQFVQMQLQQREQMQDGSTSTLQVRTRTEAQVAADAIAVAVGLLGQNGPRMSQVAQEMNQAMTGLAESEEVLQERSRLQTFLFGQDDEVVAEMQQVMQQNQDRLKEMEEYMLNCTDCDQGTTEALITQIQKMEQEQTRLQDVVDEAGNRRGVFGFLFGWLQ